MYHAIFNYYDHALVQVLRVALSSHALLPLHLSNERRRQLDDSKRHGIVHLRVKEDDTSYEVRLRRRSIDITANVVPVELACSVQLRDRRPVALPSQHTHVPKRILNQLVLPKLGGQRAFEKTMSMKHTSSTFSLQLLEEEEDALSERMLTLTLHNICRTDQGHHRLLSTQADSLGTQLVPTGKVYCEVWLDGKQVAVTNVIEGVGHPTWNNERLFILMPADIEVSVGE